MRSLALQEGRPDALTHRKQTNKWQLNKQRKHTRYNKENKLQLLLLFSACRQERTHKLAPCA